MKKVVGDQADGLRRLMASSPGRLVTLVGCESGVSTANVAANLGAALTQQGLEVRVLDECNGALHLQRDERLTLLRAQPDGDGALSRGAALADDVLVVLQANAESIMQAYACIKRLHYAHALQRVCLLVEQVADAVEAKQILANLALTGSRYLSVALEPAGWVRADPLVLQAQRLGLTVVEAFPGSPAAGDFRQVAADLLHWPGIPAAGPLLPHSSVLARQEVRSAAGMHGCR